MLAPTALHVNRDFLYVSTSQDGADTTNAVIHRYLITRSGNVASGLTTTTGHVVIAIPGIPFLRSITTNSIEGNLYAMGFGSLNCSGRNSCRCSGTQVDRGPRLRKLGSLAFPFDSQEGVCTSATYLTLSVGVVRNRSTSVDSRDESALLSPVCLIASSTMRVPGGSG